MGAGFNAEQVTPRGQWDDQIQIGAPDDRSPRAQHTNDQGTEATGRLLHLFALVSLYINVDYDAKRQEFHTLLCLLCLCHCAASAHPSDKERRATMLSVRWSKTRSNGALSPRMICRLQRTVHFISYCLHASRKDKPSPAGRTRKE